LHWLYYTHAWSFAAQPQTRSGFLRNAPKMEALLVAARLIKHRVVYSVGVRALCLRTHAQNQWRWHCRQRQQPRAPPPRPLCASSAVRVQAHSADARSALNTVQGPGPWRVCEGSRCDTRSPRQRRPVADDRAGATTRAASSARPWAQRTTQFFGMVSRLRLRVWLRVSHVSSMHFSPQRVDSSPLMPWLSSHVPCLCRGSHTHARTHARTHAQQGRGHQRWQGHAAQACAAECC
jgi:hypothetical protein